jgi:hypothetical protein
LTASIVAAFPGGLARAQVDQKLTPAIRSAVIDSIAAKLERIYVEPDTGRMIGQSLQAKLEAGAYDKLDNPAQFAEMVTRDLRALNGDLHLGLRYSPTPPAGALPGGSPPRRMDGRRQNFGLGKVEILDGNVGYLEITGFMGLPGYQDVVVDALRFLSRTDAVIIDLRRNGGGSGEMSHFVFSHFLDSVPVNTISVRRRPPAQPVVRQSLAAVPGPRRTATPLYLLTSRNTASAAEEFSFVLKNQKRVTTVGGRTAGAGHMVTSTAAGHGFTVSISITRVSDPVTGKEWEGTGVAADIAVPVEQALTAAHAAALRSIITGMKDEQETGYLTRLLVSLDARREPRAVDPTRLARYAGSYEGRVVSVAGGRLHYARREGGLSEVLVPLSDTRFALGATQLQFEEQGGSIRLIIEQSDGTHVTLNQGS